MEPANDGNAQWRPKRFLVYSTAGPQRDLAGDAREQAWWDPHAAFIDGLVTEGFNQLSGPLGEEGGGFLIDVAQSEAEARARLRHDPWYAHEILSLVWVKRWRIFIDTWEATSGAWRTRAKSGQPRREHDPICL